MWDEGAGLGVVFNGEIYNYRDLRERYGASTFRTHSDTEVVLKSLAARGTRAIDDWNGMFAVASWDMRTRKLLLIRDRVGVKPLYYWWDGKCLLFASEIKAILASGLVSRRVNRQAVWDYLTFRYVPGPESIWEGIRKLPPGHVLELSYQSPPRETRYWMTDVVADEREVRSEQEIDREFAQLFLDAVQLRLIAADVPVGVLLSGGLDSSAVAAAAVELGHRNFHTFSVGFDDPLYSELNYARAMASHVNAQYHDVVVTQERFLNLLPEMVVSADEPLADLAAVPLLEVSRLARQNVKVVLSGEGSDELLAGYDLDRAERKWTVIRQLQRLPRPVLATGAAAVAVLAPARSSVAQRVASEPVSEWMRTDLEHMTWLLEEEEKQRLWNDRVAAQASSRVLIDLYAQARSSDPLQQMLSVYQKSWLVEDLLMKADKMSMAASIELRTPFLDYRMVEWANRLPNSAKVKRTGFRRYETKAVLRRFAARRLPEEIISRPKRGFPVPAYTWLSTGLSQWAENVLLGRDSRTARAFDHGIVRRFLSQAAAGHTPSAHNVWNLLVLEFWLRAWSAEL